ncbi:FAD-linked oxidoreductase-like protein [Microdochium trichocladiopsis]|uniref:Proline dehydrogenase n=1 Tax=Microdochium trichocladiopsis TaxID=1682393 RepID=A0A9P9BQC8_9PEZI|nr:FAD-linked oxidoreductase-like protein [Microdochium trichocladiopsis]KAH7030723.1 FAD-linked oxidoreductase-like protein [Microdochium trichocladiopsis]
MLSALREICADCASRSVRVIVDAESQHFQHGIALTTLQLMREFNRGGGEKGAKTTTAAATVYNTYQAYLKATPALVEEHMRAAHEEGFTLGLKLVRGAYILSDDRRLIHDTKQDTDDAYNAIARGALERSFGAFGDDGASAAGKGHKKYPFPSTNLLLASHNRASVFAAYELHRQRVAAGLPTVPVAFGQLHGMSDEVSFGLLEHGRTLGAQAASASPRAVAMDGGAGGSDLAYDSAKGNGQPYPPAGDGNAVIMTPDVFKCTTWGSMSECIAYLVRRAVENRDAVLRTSDEYTALKNELWQRLFTWK